MNSSLRGLRVKRARHFPDVSDAPERREKAIASGRVFLAAGALLAVHWGPINPVENSPLITGLLLGYLVLSLVLWATLQSRPTSDPAVSIGAHSADVICTAALTVLSWGPGSPFFLFFVFVLLAAAYRWGFQGTMLTAGAGVALLAGEAYILTPMSLPARLLSHIGLRSRQEFQLNVLVVRCAYLLMVGLLLGYLAEGEKSLQSEAAATAQIVGKAQVGGGLKITLEGILDELLAAFGVVRGLIVIEEVESGRMFVWEALRPGRRSRVEVTVNEAEPIQHSAYRCTGETGGWAAWKKRDGDYRFRTLPSEDEATEKRDPGALPAKLEGCDSVLAAPFRLARQWRGCVYLLNVRIGLNRGKELRFLRHVVDAAAPAVYNAYLLSRMRSQIGAHERGRLARELHDGAIQSLVAAELQVDVLRRKAAATSAEHASPLDDVENLIHEQVLNLRELMEKIRPIDPDPRRLPEFLAEQVEKFQRETGIDATFSGEDASVRLTGRACRELIHILQELLFNVRRHSGAERVEVKLASRNGTCRLEVNDNGRGFDFAGRFDETALEAMRKGPRVVQERVRMLGGRMEIESYPGKGARLQITLTQREE